jgi:site-specific DNA-cytosine methylase
MVNTTGGGSSDGRRVRSADKSIENPSLTIHNNQPSLRDTTDKPVKIRSLTLPETLVLQGFNPDYDLSAARTMKSRWTMVGNAVPPPVAEAVIRGIHNDEGN